MGARCSTRWLGFECSSTTNVQPLLLLALSLCTYTYLDQDVGERTGCARHLTTRYFIMYTHIAVPTSTSFPSYAKDKSSHCESFAMCMCMCMCRVTWKRDTPRLVHVATRRGQERYSCQCHRQATKTSVFVQSEPRSILQGRGPMMSADVAEPLVERTRGVEVWRNSQGRHWTLESHSRIRCAAYRGPVDWNRDKSTPKDHISAAALR
jgi:hypothetical protein